eukprot:305796-Amphidinium_carterae.1
MLRSTMHVPQCCNIFSQEVWVVVGCGSDIRTKLLLSNYCSPHGAQGALAKHTFSYLTASCPAVL